MKRSMIVIVAVLMAASASLWAQSSKDAVAVDPTHHHVIMENDRVRVFEVLAKPGDTSAMHTHPPLVLISLGTARVKMTTPDGKSSLLDLHPAQTLWLENVEHSWELLAGQIHLVAVEVKACK